MTAPVKKPKTARGQRTLRNLLDAAALEFGSKGYHDASVAGITSKAGIAQGTFYIYFSSKEEIFRELVLDLGRTLREELSANVAGAPDRLTAERQGLGYFIQFVRDHPHLYRIVMEAQYVDESAFRKYFTDFASAYSVKLQRALVQGEIRSGPTDERAWALLGISLFLGLRYGLWGHERPVDEVVDAVMDLVEHGLRQPPEQGVARD
ncbi:MAG: TetR/AcrR family transcriptional regulator [Proteobacteria bacterium]|nr:MAG: TetR/AcrR family transcriptional regulator [Pseudomonadota bacterium]QKK10717.1 MAG: TetR/AcrR family transcriptional regulator [Pseudomonadota bacterium]